MRRFAFSVGLVFVAASMTVLLGEAFVRLVAPQPESWLAIYRSHSELPFYAMLPNHRARVDSGETDWSVETDERGFRVSAEGRDGADCSVLWLGDSFAFGHGVDYDDSFVGRIASRTPDVGHVNSAVPGYGPVQYRATLEYLAGDELQFDWIFVASYLGNDYHDTQWEKGNEATGGILGNPGGLKSFLKRNWHVYRLLSAAYHRLGSGGARGVDSVSAELGDPDAWGQEFLVLARDRYAEELTRIQEYAEARGIPVAFIILPTRDAAAHRFSVAAGGGAPAVSSGLKDFDPMLPVEHARAILEGMGATYLDLTDVLGSAPPEEMFFRFDGHFTPVANQRVAEAIARRFPLRCDMEGIDGA